MKLMHFRKLLIVLALALAAAGTIATYAIDIPCGGPNDPYWPPCDTNPSTKGN